MAKLRVGFSSDFVLENSEVGIGTTNPTAKLHVAGVAKADFNITGVSTLRSYGGFIAQKQNITKASAIGFGTVGLQTVGVSTGYSYYETETGYTSLVGEYNTLSDDLIVDDGKIFEIKTTSITGVTTIGTQSYDYDTSRVDLGTLESISIQSHFTLPNGGIETRPENPIEGTVRFNDDLNTLEFYNGIEWRQFTVTGASGRGIFAGGNRGPSEVYNIEYINITTTGNSSNFGTIASSTSRKGGCGSSTRGLLGGGSPNSTVIDYLTIASEGNTVSFGSLTVGRYAITALSSSTRGIWGGGYTGGTGTRDVLDYVEIATTGTALDFGNLAVPTYGVSALSSPTRGIWAGGFTPTPVSTRPRTIDFITIASKGDAIDFGNLSVEHHYGAGASNGIRGVFSGGSPGQLFNTIDYITIASNGNAIDFGDLTLSRETTSGGVSNSIRGVFGSGYAGPAAADIRNTIDYITFNTLGNAQDFGDMSNVLTYYGAISDSHGGLGGF